MRSKIRTVFIILNSVMLCTTVRSQVPSGFGSREFTQTSACLKPQQRADIRSKLAQSVRSLAEQGKISVKQGAPSLVLEWPVVGAPGQTDFGYHTITNFVDLNQGFPNQILDYNCGIQSYDLANGYNHSGIDIAIWPFPWYRMDQDQVIVVAAAPGVIIGKDDGNFDRSCGFNNQPWNAVYIQHADGSTAWYGHLKNGSLTDLEVGATVVTGDFLGVVGSSGSSTVAHLHLEIQDSQGNVIEPFSGPCNPGASLWANQRPYFDSAINKLMTHSTMPVFPACPEQEILNESNRFEPGDLAYFAAYYRDQLGGQISRYTIYQPDGAVFQEWTHSSTLEHRKFSWWFWTWFLPSDAQEGSWTFEVVYEGQAYIHEFTVRSPPNTSTDGDWSDHTAILSQTPEAELMVRTGDIDNLGFGWPEGYDPFSGTVGPLHAFPWQVDPADPVGTDRIMVVSSFVGTPPAGSDGYTLGTARPDNNVQSVTLIYPSSAVDNIHEGRLLLFVDDLQAPLFDSNFEVTLDSVRVPELEELLNALSQTGPRGQLITLSIPTNQLHLLSDGRLEIKIDDNTTGAGDGYAIDFAKLLLNPKRPAQLAINPTSIDFGEVVLLEDITEQVMVANAGGDTLHVQSPTVSGPDAANFSVDPIPFSVAPGDTFYLDVLFAPQIEGEFSGSVTISTSVGDTSVTLTGTGIVLPTEPTETKMIPADGDANDQFGQYVAMWGQYILSGAFLDEENGNSSGSAYIFMNDGSDWIEQSKLTPNDAEANMQFGQAVSIHGSYAVVGAGGGDGVVDASGAAYVFKRNENSWVQVAKLFASDGQNGDRFGITVAIEGSYIFVGAPGDDDSGQQAGAAYMFRREGDTWTEQAKLTGSNVGASDGFGNGSISAYRDWLFIPAPNHDEAGIRIGAVYIFKREGETYVEQQMLTVSDLPDRAQFGSSLSGTSNYLIVGTSIVNMGAVGKSYVFERIADNWNETTTLTASDGHSQNLFGSSVAIQNDLAIVGAVRDQENGIQSGAVYVFERDGSSWTESAKITPNDGDANDQFGVAVAFSGSHLVVGSVGDEGNDTGAASGSAYVYSDFAPSPPQAFTQITSGDIATDLAQSYGNAWGDYDRDGYDDLFVANLGDNLFYQNNGDGSFTKITTGIVVNDGGNSWAAAWADYDNDDDLDLFVANGGNVSSQNNFLYENNGDGTFNKVTEGAIVNDGGASFGANWADYDNDGDLDLFVPNQGSSSAITECDGSANFPGEKNFLYENNGDGSFTKVTAGAIVNDIAPSRGSAWADYNDDGKPDLFVANYNTADNALYENMGGGTFSKITVGPVVTDGGCSNGGSWGDLDNDGDLDLFVANTLGQVDFLYENKGDGTFMKVTDDAIVTDATFSSGSTWVDFDNDGDLDLFITGGLGGNKNRLFSNNGTGGFSEILTEKLASDFGATKGTAWADYDLNGTLDVFFASSDPDSANLLFRNQGNANNWIKISLIGTVSNRSGIGAKVRVKALGAWHLRVVSAQTGRGGQNSLYAEFGLGSASVIDSIRVEWPSGTVQVLTNVAVNRRLSVVEESSISTSAEIPPGDPPPIDLAGTQVTLDFEAGPGGSVDVEEILTLPPQTPPAASQRQTLKSGETNEALIPTPSLVAAPSSQQTVTFLPRYWQLSSNMQGGTFNYALKIGYDPAEFPEGLTEDNATIFFFDATMSEYVALPTVRHPAADSVQTASNLNGFGRFALGAEQVLTYNISGDVSYYQSGVATESVAMAISGGLSSTTHSDASGSYAHQNLPASFDYTLKPAKDGDLGLFALTCFDAALIAQHAIGASSLGAELQKAADVDQDGSIFVFDAALACRFAIGLPPFGPNDHAGEWRFEPDSLVYQALASDQSEQNFVARILGDVDASWQPNAGAEAATLAKSNSPQISFEAPEWKSDSEEFATTLKFLGGSDALSFQFDLRFDPARLGFVKAECNLEGWTLVENQNEEGRLRIGMYAAVPIEAQQEFVTISWQVLEAGENTIISLDHALVNREPQASAMLELETSARIPTEFALHQNYPNPFNPETTIRYELPEAGEVRLLIYNLRGQVVRVLLDESKKAGFHGVTWDGKDSLGRRVGSGVYLYRISVGEFTATKKLTLLR